MDTQEISKPRSDALDSSQSASGPPSRWQATVSKVGRYGPGFVVEVVIFWVMLEAFQQLNYGGRIVTSAQSRPILFLSVAMVVLALGAGEARFRLYRRIWAVAGIHDALATGLAVAEATGLITLANWVLPGDYRVFRLAVPLLAAPAALLGIGMFRLLPRLLSRTPSTGSRLLIVASSASLPGVKALVQSPSPEWQAVAIVTTDRTQLNHTVLGVPVVGHAGDLAHWVTTTDADGVAFVLGRDPVPDDKHLFGVCLQAGLPLFIVPATDGFFNQGRGARLRQLSADDLVGRQHRELDLKPAAKMIAGNTVLVTGAAGSIGSEMCRQLVKLRPQRIVLVDNNESGLFDIAEELRVAGQSDLREALVSVADAEQLLTLFADERPQIVFHAAAYKHVPMLEAHPAQAVLNNVVGTRNTLRSAEAAGVRYFILISTDKAVARHSVMGCTKRLCELIVLGYRGEMRCSAVRFGNVVGSRGSVVPLFERQIEAGGPVTITHADVTRFMMTIREAVSLVISSLVLASPGHLYMLDMGESMKIESLARSLIRARGLRPGIDIEIIYTGLRPGERLTEELMGPEEGSRPTSHPAIMEVISPSPLSRDDLEWTIERLRALANEGRTEELVRALRLSVGSRVATEEPTPRPMRAVQPDPRSGAQTAAETT